MTIKDMIDSIREKSREKKEVLRQMEIEDRARHLLEEKKMSANERELNRFMKENREEQIKTRLEEMRRARKDDIELNHNPLDTPNVTKTGRELLKDKNLFAGKGNIFSANSLFRNKSYLMR